MFSRPKVHAALLLMLFCVAAGSGCRQLYLKDDRKTDTVIGFHSKKIVEEAVDLFGPPPPSELPADTEARREELVGRIVSRSAVIAETVAARRDRHGSAVVDFPDDFEGQMKQSYKVLGGYEQSTRSWQAWERRAARAAGGILDWLTGNPGFGISIMALLAAAAAALKERIHRGRAQALAQEREERARMAERASLDTVEDLKAASRRGEPLEDAGGGTEALRKATIRLKPAFERKRRGEI